MMKTRIYESFQKLKETLKPMTGKQRVEHIWEYYKAHMFIAAMIILVLVIVVTSIVNSQKEILISGILANVDMTEEGRKYIDEDYLRYMGGSPKNGYVRLGASYFKDIYTSAEAYDANYNAVSSVVSMAGAKSLDYLLMDRVSMEIFITQDILMDLTDFFSGEEIASFGERLIYLEIKDEEGNFVSRCPVALNISDMPFAQDCLNVSDGCYFALAAGTPRLDTCRNFWEYLLAWE